MNKEDDILEKAYLEAKYFTQSHYENFPVISLTLSGNIRKHIAVVYQFARQADDLADEGEVDSECRIKNLELYEKDFSACINGEYKNSFWMALNNTIIHFQLDRNNFYNLISAFKQDVVKVRYSSFEELLDYCRRSANPVGRIILELFNVRNMEAVEASDAICTALQLTNFYQDVSVDILKGRIYIPLEDLKNFNVEEKLFALKQNNANFKQLMKFQIERTEKLFDMGNLLLYYLPKGLKTQIRLTMLGGRAILKKIEQIDYNVLNARPKLQAIDKLKLFLRIIF